MKKILLFTLLIACFGLSAQNLSLNELIALRKMTLEEVETSLTKKGWELKDGHEPEDKKMGAAVFAYSSSGDYQYAESFISYLYLNNGSRRITIQLSDQTKYLEYLATIKKFAPSPVSTKMKDGNLVKIYVADTTTFAITTTRERSKAGDTIPLWFLVIAENLDYKIQFGY